MFLDFSRDKLINAIIFFVKNTKRCHTLKLFKLLHFLDFEHYRQTGYGVTGLTYKAWKNGPAPSELWHELPNPEPDLARAVAINPKRDPITDRLLSRTIIPKLAFNPDIFSKREMEIMQMLAFFFKEANAEDMSEISHARNLPWGKVFQGGRGESREIPYELSLESTPVIPKMPSLSPEAYRYRREAFEGIDDA